jgi:hypothetical protein
MPWTFHTSPLDQTLASLEWLAHHMDRQLASKEEITLEDYRAIRLGIGNIIRDLQPLQDARVEERRAEPSE